MRSPRPMNRDQLRAEIEAWRRRVAEADRDAQAKGLIMGIGARMQLWSASRILRQLEAVLAAEDEADRRRAQKAGRGGPWV